MTETNDPKQPRVAVGAVVFKDGKVLLVQRGKAPAQGTWAIPGGKVRYGEPLREAVRREIREETGILVDPGKVVLVFDPIIRDESGRIAFHYVIIDYEARYVRGELRAGDDARDVRWVAREDLGRLNVNPRTRALLKEAYNFG